MKKFIYFVLVSDSKDAAVNNNQHNLRFMVYQ